MSEKLFIVRKVRYANGPDSWRVLRLCGYTHGRPSYTRLSQRFYSQTTAQVEADRLISERSSATRDAGPSRDAGNSVQSVGIGRSHPLVDLGVTLND